jgi:hypothetical protein
MNMPPRIEIDVERDQSLMTPPISLAVDLETLRQDQTISEVVSKRSLAPESSAYSLSEMVDLLIASLEDVEKSVADRTETLLTRIGRPAIPSLIQGLRSPHIRVRSVCAMVLIRLGEPVLEDLRECYIHSQHLPKLCWIIETIFNELGNQPVPIAETVHIAKVLPFKKG